MRYLNLVRSSVVLLALGAAAGFASAEAAPKKGGGGGAAPKGKDTVAPALSVPADFTAAAAVQFGARVSFVVTASDNKDPAPVVVLSKSSGSMFPIGTTTVTATATDSAGNATTRSFKITVAPYAGGDRAYTSYSYDSDQNTWFEWDITVAANGTVTGTGRQTNVLVNYDGYLWAEPLPDGLTGAGTISGTIASDGTCRFTSSSNWWTRNYEDYDAEGNPAYTENAGGFSGSATVNLGGWGALHFTPDPLDSPPDLWGVNGIWVPQ